jgi:hypothetical protein
MARRMEQMQDSVNRFNDNNDVLGNNNGSGVDQYLMHKYKKSGSIKSVNPISKKKYERLKSRFVKKGYETIPAEKIKGFPQGKGETTSKGRKSVIKTY